MMVEKDEGGERPSRASEAFFGRRRGKALTTRQQGELRNTLAALALDLSAPPPGDLRSLFEADVDDVRLEIGFGGGEHLLHETRRLAKTGFIGVEPFVNGMAKLSGSLADDPRANLRVHDDDATALLDWLPPASLAGIDLLYPDPWPKKRHFKRRFVSMTNLDRFARVLMAGGRFRFASDIATYVEWTLDHCARHPAFAEEGADERASPYEAWPGTRYEAKAMREGRDPAYLTFIRR